MAYLTKDNTLLAAEIETNEGEYVAPVAGTSFLNPLSDGLELMGAKELKERNILSGSIGSVTPRVGQRSASGTIPIELKSKGTAGGAPQWEPLLMSLLGSKRQNTTTVTTKTVNTTTVLKIEDTDIAKFAVGDIVLVKEAGKYHLSPIASRVTTPGSATITLLIAAAAAFSDNVVIDKFTTYKPANNGHKSLSITRYLENAIIDKAWGMRAVSMALNNFSTGGIADLSFALEGMDYAQEVGSPSQTPSYDTALPPLILSACVYQDGVKVPINDLSLSIENTIGWITSTCSESGRISSRVTKRSISGSINPYKLDNAVDNFTKFRNNTPFSLFFYAYNPTATAGEFKDVVAFYLPSCLTVELKNGDKDAVITDEISFSADRGADGSNDEIFMGFI